MIRTRKFKYCVYDSIDNKESQVDMENDPGEMRNLVGDRQFKDVLAEHRRLLADWARLSNDEDGLEYIRNSRKRSRSAGAART